MTKLPLAWVLTFCAQASGNTQRLFPKQMPTLKIWVGGGFRTRTCARRAAATGPMGRARGIYIARARSTKPFHGWIRGAGEILGLCMNTKQIMKWQAEWHIGYKVQKHSNSHREVFPTAWLSIKTTTPVMEPASTIVTVTADPSFLVVIIIEMCSTNWHMFSSTLFFSCLCACMCTHWVLYYYAWL